MLTLLERTCKFLGYFVTTLHQFVLFLLVCDYFMHKTRFMPQKFLRHKPRRNNENRLYHHKSLIRVSVRWISIVVIFLGGPCLPCNGLSRVELLVPRGKRHVERQLVCRPTIHVFHPEVYCSLFLISMVVCVCYFLTNSSWMHEQMRPTTIA